jgi:hypothetical protein
MFANIRERYCIDCSNRIYTENDLYNKCRQLEGYSFEANLQSDLIDKLITMATINTKMIN